MVYVDGFVAAVPTANREAFRKHAEEAAVLFKKHGALRVIESWADDVPRGEVTDFYRAVQCKDDETVLFSWVMWPDKTAREEGNKKVFEDMQTSGMTEMPFDGKRMIYGGFEAIVDV